MAMRSIMRTFLASVFPRTTVTLKPRPLKAHTDLLQRPVGPQGLVGDGLDGVKAAREQTLGFQLVCVLGEEPLALASTPCVGKLALTEKDIGRVGIAGAPQQRRALAMLAATWKHQLGRLSLEKVMGIKDHRGGVGLLAVDDEGVGARASLDNRVRQLL